MTVLNSKRPVAILLDIEGTTTPIDFVYKVLFPYARNHARTYLEANRSSAEVRSDIEALIAENAEDACRGLDPPSLEGSAGHISLDPVLSYLHWLMDRDSKNTALKSIQGKIWLEGYHRGELRSQIFEDVPRAFKRWRDQGIGISIYSSGSVLAQRLLFANTEAGDLGRFIDRYFDTNIGAKVEKGSYVRIAEEFQVSPTDLAFVSDVISELDAADAAGLETMLCIRPGNHPQPVDSNRRIVRSFDEIGIR